MAKKKGKKKNPEDIGTDNELMKLKIMAEFGGDFMGDGNIPPEVENQFLKQILSFHKKHNSSNLITIYQFIGSPEYNHVHDLSDKELPKELNRLMKLMKKNGIILNVLSDPPKKEVYRFITEELFKHEIEDVRVKGWTSQFIYEEFHPNPEYDVKSVVSSCLHIIFNKDSFFFPEHFSEGMKNSIGLSMDIEELEEKIREFQSHFHNIRFDHFDGIKIEVDEDAGKAHVTCKAFYKTQPAKGKRYKMESTNMEFSLVKHKDVDGWWEIDQIISDIL